LYYLLLTDSGEPECYEEGMKVDTKKKWEKGMKEKMDYDLGGYRWPPTFSNWLKTIFWQF
jgi:hypothetical protein